MNIIAVDDERPALRMLEKSILAAEPDCTLSCFSKAKEALEFAQENIVDVAFLDINMAGMDGLSLAHSLKEIRKNTNILFVTGHQQYAIDAFALAASGYILKPPNAVKIAEGLSQLRYPIKQKYASDGTLLSLGQYEFDHATKRVYFQGRDTLLKPKEYLMFCLLADNLDKFFTAEEIYRAVWGDEPKGNLHTVYVRISDLRQKLSMSNTSDYTIQQKRGSGYRLCRNGNTGDNDA